MKPYLSERRRGGGADLAGVMALFGFLGTIYVGVLLMKPLFAKVTIFNRPAASTPSGLTFSLGGSTPVSTPSLSPTPLPSLTSVMVMPDRFPTYTPYPTYTPVSTLQPYEVFYYSIYDPMVLWEGDFNDDGTCANVTDGVCHTMNCWDWDIEAGICRSPMASGLPFESYYGKAVACGYEYPLYTVFEVTYPLEIAGSYTCLDRCPACTGKRQLDFLSHDWVLPAQWEVHATVYYK